MKPSFTQSQFVTRVKLFAGITFVVCGSIWAWYVFGGPSDVQVIACGGAHGEEVPEVSFAAGDVTCGTPDDCRFRAEAAFQKGVVFLAQRDQHPANLSKAFVHFSEAGVLVSAAESSPDLLPELPARTEEARQLMKEEFQSQRIRYKNYEKRKMYFMMQQTLTQMETQFPDARLKKRAWVEAQRRDMREKGIPPS